MNLEGCFLELEMDSLGLEIHSEIESSRAWVRSARELEPKLLESSTKVVELECKSKKEFFLHYCKGFYN